MNLKKTNVILVVTILLGLRSLYDANIAQAIVSIGFLTVYGYMKYLETIQKHDINNEIKHELEVIKTNISGIMMKNAIKPVEQVTNKRFF